jgi:mono/diheme cytochrome c family protein
MRRMAFFGFVVVALLASGCADLGRPGDAQRGQALFSELSIRNTPGCVTCHSLEPNKVVVGPSLWGVETRAERIVHSPDYHGSAVTAEQYLRESITRPDAYVAVGSAHSVMPDWLTVLDEQQIQDLVAYLMTQKQ